MKFHNTLGPVICLVSAAVLGGCVNVEEDDEPVRTTTVREEVSTVSPIRSSEVEVERRVVY